MSDSETPETPLASVVVTTYFRNQSLVEALTSVENQSYENIETILVDGSEERHAQPIVDNSSVIDIYIAPDKDPGVAGARRAGIKAASGDFIHFLDDDDTLREEAIRFQVDRLLQSSDETVGSFGGFYREVHDTTVVPNGNSGGGIGSNFERRILTTNSGTYLPSTFCAKRNALIKCEPVPEELDGCEDLALALNLLEVGPIIALPKVVANRGGGEWDGLADSIFAAQQRFKLFEYYSERYEAHPNAERRFFAESYFRRGIARLRVNTWSFKAVVDFWRCLYFHPNPPMRHVGAAIVSPLGWTIWSFTRDTLSRIKN